MSTPVGGLDDNDVCGVNDTNVYSHSHAYGLRPIFHLRSNIKVTGGTGKIGNAYTLGT